MTTLSSITPRRGTVHKVFSGLLLMLALSALAMAGYQTTSGHWHATPVLSGSMRPGLQPGDVVVTQRVPITDLTVRDVIVFQPPEAGARQTVHRIVNLTVKDGTTSITMRGDANTADDPAKLSLSGTTAYRVTRVVPLLGYPAIWLQNGSHGRLAMVLGVMLLIVAAVTVFRPEKPTAQADTGDLAAGTVEVLLLNRSPETGALSQPPSTPPISTTPTSTNPADELNAGRVNASSQRTGP